MIDTLTVVLAQIDLLVGDMEGNADKIVDAIARARDQHFADLVVFPELSLSGYPPEDLLLRPELWRRVEHCLAGIRRCVFGIDVLVGLPEATDEGLFNSAYWLRCGEILGRYRKQLLPNYGVFDEKRYFTAGTEPCVVELQGVSIGVTICEDIWSPGPAAQAKAAGAQMLVNLNASPFDRLKPGARKASVAARVRETGLPVVYVNLVGGQDELVFDGGSFVMGRQGGKVFSAPAFEDGLYALTFDTGTGEPIPRSGPVWVAESEEALIYRALVVGTRDYIRKNGFDGAVIGLSGGIDSALTAAIATDALGAERVNVVMMPYRYTAAMSLEDAEAEAEALGIDYRVIPIEEPVLAFQQVLSSSFEGMERDVTEENIQARCRGVILMALSNKLGRMLLTTGNKSEMSVGYATLYGDMAGGYAPLKDVPKTLVYRLAEYRNSLSPVIPQRVLDRPPSAELAPDQKDADSLPPYEVLDPILEAYVERDLAIDEIVASGFDTTTVTRVARMVDRNEYKRRQAPLACVLPCVPSGVIAVIP